MAYGLRTYDASGNILFDSEAFVGGWVAGIELGGNTARWVSYPDYAGRTGYTVGAAYNVGSNDLTWDYSLGYPRVLIPSTGGVPCVFINLVK